MYRPPRTSSWSTTATRTASGSSLVVGEHTGSELVADHNRLHQLLENAVDHGGADVTVRLKSTATGFEIEEDGPGIAAADHGSLFDVGYTSAPNGTGLGLAIVRRIAEVHGWDVRVTTGELGGARFEFIGVDTVV